MEKKAITKSNIQGQPLQSMSLYKDYTSLQFFVMAP